jgi:hypothetical protein
MAKKIGQSKLIKNKRIVVRIALPVTIGYETFSPDPVRPAAGLS